MGLLHLRTKRQKHNNTFHSVSILSSSCSQTLTTIHALPVTACYIPARVRERLDALVRMQWVAVSLCWPGSVPVPLQLLADCPPPHLFFLCILVRLYHSAANSQHTATINVTV